MTLSDLLSAARRQTLDTTNAISDNDLTEIINEGLRMVSIAERWPWLLTSAQVTVVNGTREYDISSDLSVTDFMWVDSVVDNDQEDGMLDEWSYSTYLYKYGGDPPSGSRAYHFYIKASDTLGLVPTPSANETDAYTLNYYKTPTDLSLTTDTPGWTSTLHTILVDYAASKIWEREEYFAERDAAFQKFLMGVVQLKEFYRMRSKDRPMILGDGGGSNIQTSRASAVYNLPFG